MASALAGVAAVVRPGLLPLTALVALEATVLQLVVAVVRLVSQLRVAVVQAEIARPDACVVAKREKVQLTVHVVREETVRQAAAAAVKPVLFLSAT